MSRKIFTIFAATVLGLSACGEAQVVSTSDSVAPAPTVALSDAYVLMPLKGRDVTAGYFIAQGGEADTRLVAAESPFARTIELHTHTMSDGVMQMRKVDGIDIPASETVSLEPGGLHLMIFGIDFAEGQDAVPVTLRFEDGSEIETMMPLRERG